MKKTLIILLPLLFTAQACNYLSKTLSGGEPKGAKGVFVSFDSGETWEERNSTGKTKGLAGGVVMRIVMHPRETRSLMAMTQNFGVSASNNGGEEWFTILPNFSAYDGFFDPEKNEEIFVGGHRSRIATILKSTDSGGTWVQIYSEPTAQAAVTAMTYDPKSPSVFYAGLSTGTILKSQNSGETWSAVSQLKDRIIKLVFSPDGKLLYLLGREQGVKKSSDDGKTWTNLTVANAEAPYNDLTYDFNSPATLYLGLKSGMYVSRDTGGSWTKIVLPATPQVVNVSAIAVNAKDTKQIFAAVESTVYRSDDRGQTWRTVSLPTGRIISQIIIDPKEPNQIYAGLQ